MTRRLVTYGILCLAMVAGWFAIAYRPADRRMTELEKQTLDAEARLKDFETTLLTLPAYLETRKDLLSSKQGLESKLYGKNQILKLFARLNDDAAAHRLTITEITPPLNELLELNESAQDNEQPQFLNLTLNITGNYVDLGQFVSGLETMPFFFGINHCRIAQQSEENGTTAISLGLRALLTGPGREE